MNKYLSRAFKSTKNPEMFMVIGGVLAVFLWPVTDVIHMKTNFDVGATMIGAFAVTWNCSFYATVLSRAHQYRRDDEEKAILEKLEDV